MTHKPYIIAVLITLSLGACTHHSSDEYITPAGFSTGATERAPVLNGVAAATAQQIFASRSAVVGNPDDYRITPLDVVEISVLGAQDLNRTVQVSSSGRISLPLIKTIQAGGLTPGELENVIAAKLQATYMQSPQVSVFVKEFNSQRITVDGAVMKPGIFPFSGQVSLVQAIALAQGVGPIADVNAVLVFRTNGGKRSVAKFDLAKIRTGGSPDPMLRAGDIVMVDESASKATLRTIKEALPLASLFQYIAF